jgi:hypothetical protein
MADADGGGAKGGPKEVSGGAEGFDCSGMGVNAPGEGV